MTDQELDQYEEDAKDGCLFDTEALELVAEVRRLRALTDSKPKAASRWLPWNPWKMHGRKT